jgi:hypothetical protein
MLFCAGILCFNIDAKAQSPAVFKSKGPKNVDTILIYNPYYPVYSFDIARRDTFRACPENVVIQWPDVLNLAAKDCEIIADNKVYTKFVCPTPQVQMYNYISKNSVYPDDARVANIHGIVVVEFRLADDGKVLYPVIYSALFPSIDREAIRLISAMRAWYPGKDNSRFRCRILLRF